MKCEQIGFPAGTISEAPARVPLIFAGTGAFALSKPAGVPAEKILAALRARIAAGKNLPCELHAEKPQIVFAADTEASGIVLFADKETTEFETWRNALGSSQIEQTFLLLARQNDATTNPKSPPPTRASEFSCELPVAKHFSEPRALVSHKTGKKSRTTFSCEEAFPPWGLWRATTMFARFHQLPLHAAESGIPIVGDEIYGHVPAIKISELRLNKRLNKGEDKAFYAAQCLHLWRATASFTTNPPQNFPPPLTIVAPLPAGFESLIKKLRQCRNSPHTHR
ncbi:MAG: hypothetical protein LUD39_01970 [Opitutae bacterium]|nr:hypothetical protein [Opitutae bacterium]MCD8298515.1 hypothetical protein [Opitutae bacterium]